jgi:hypothetical protein
VIIETTIIGTRQLAQIIKIERSKKQRGMQKVACSDTIIEIVEERREDGMKINNQQHKMNMV